MSLVGASRRMGNLLVGSWLRTTAVALLVLLVFVIAAWAGSTGRLADLRYANIPWVHPYPPAGYYINPLNPTGDRGDLVNATEAAKVKADLLADGNVELVAVRQGDAALLGGADSGNRLQRLRQVIDGDNADGVYAIETTTYRSIVVGHLSDPNEQTLNWCVEEKGKSTIQYLSKSSGTVVRSETFTFDDKFWLVWSGTRYLITDAAISNQPIPQGS